MSASPSAPALLDFAHRPIPLDIPMRRFAQPFFALSVAFSASAGAQSMDQTPPRVIGSEQLAKYWVMTNTAVDADVPNFGRNMNQPGCATVSFVIEKTGATSTIKVQRVVPEGDLGKVAKSVAAGLHFEATALNAGKDRAFSWLIFPFNLPADPVARTAVMQKCFIDKLDWKDR
jgi:hypothetical protein